MLNMKGVRIGTAYYSTKKAAIAACGIDTFENGGVIVGKPKFDASKFKLVINRKTLQYFVEYL